MHQTQPWPPFTHLPLEIEITLNDGEVLTRSLVLKSASQLVAGDGLDADRIVSVRFDPGKRLLIRRPTS